MTSSTKTNKVLVITCPIYQMSMFARERFAASLIKTRKETEKRGYRFSTHNDNFSGNLVISIWKPVESEPEPQEQKETTREGWKEAKEKSGFSYEYRQNQYTYSQYDQKMAEDLFKHFYGQKQKQESDFFKSWFDEQA